MAKFWKELIGGQVKNGIYVAGPRHASSKLASFSSGNPPRLPFQYIVHFEMNDNIIGEFVWQNEPFALAQMVKSIDMPGMSITTEKRPKYNRNVPVILTKEFKPFNVIVHDDISSTWQKFWQTYYNYHFMDGRHVKGAEQREIIDRTVHNNKDVIPENDFNSQFQGIDVRQAKRSQFIDNIHIYQLHGQTVTRTTAVNPIITDVQASQLDYAGADAQEINFTIEYEKLMYSPVINFDYDEEETFLKDAIEDFTKATPFDPTGDKIKGIVKSLFGLTQRAGNRQSDIRTLSDAPRNDYGVDPEVIQGLNDNAQSVGFFGNLIRNAVRKKANELTGDLLQKNNKNLSKFKI